jgi:lipid II:glycine glycyltransferase (peptidoglycan interpeptide bridge formation enzyme)
MTFGISPLPQTPPVSAPAVALIAPDQAQWQAFVAAHPQGHLLQGAAWGELKAQVGWAVRRIALSAADGTLVAGAQLLVKRRYGVSVVYVPRGPLWSGDPARDQALLRGMIRVARRERAVFVRIEPNLREDHPGADDLHTWLLLQGAQPVAPIQPRSSIHVDLTRPEAAILAACSKGHRADIRRAERNGVQIRVGTATDLAAFYALMSETGNRAAFGIHSADYYRHVWTLHGARARLLLAEVGGAVVAAHLICADAHACAYLYSGANEQGLRAGSNHLLAWHALRWAKEQGCPIYDLWGIPDALGQAARATSEATRTALETAAQADPLIGVYRFKKGFGGTVVRYLPAYDLPLIPPLYRLALQRIGGG